MSRTTQAWLKTAVAAVGLGVSFVFAPVGVALCGLATLAGVFGVVGLNSPRVRLAYWVSLAMEVVAVQLAVGSVVLTAAVVVSGLTSPPSEAGLLLLKNRYRYAPTVGAVLAVLILALQWPGWWALAVIPNLFVGFTFGPGLIKASRRWPGLMAQVKLRVGEPLPDVALPRRDGSGTVDFKQERGHPLLILFVRGDWCPVCHVLMRVVNRERETLHQKGAKLFVITPVEGELDGDLKGQLQIGTEMLVDAGAETARRWGLLEFEKEDAPDVPLPVALLVDGDGVLCNISRPEDVTAYSSESRIARALAALPSAIPAVAR